MNTRHKDEHELSKALDFSPEADKQDIVNFIEKESLKRKKQSVQIIIESYACTLWKGFFDMKHKLYRTPNLNTLQAIDLGIRLIDNLFWILFHYSSNLQLTLFLTERGRLLYTEFLSMSRTHQLMKQMNSYPSIYDGFMFAIKKSIGSLRCSHHHTKIHFQRIAMYRASYRRLFEIINRKYLVPVKGSDFSNIMDINCSPWNDDQINITLHALNHLMSIAIEMSPDSFERCVHAYQNHDAGLAQFFLLLKLASDTICTYHHVSDEHMQQLFEFIEEHKMHITPNKIDCLNDTHYVQERWRAYRDSRCTK